MPRRLRLQLASPILSDNDDTHIAVVLNQLLVTVIALLILFGLVVGLVSERPAPLLISIGLLALLGVGSLVLIRLGHPRLAASIFLAGLWFVAVAIGAMYGGMWSSFGATCVSIVFAAGLLLGARYGLGFAILSVVAAGVLLIAESYALVPLTMIGMTLVERWLAIALNFSAAVVLLFLVSSRVSIMLARIHGNERALVKVNRQLEATVLEHKKNNESLRLKEGAIHSSLNAIALADLEGNLLYVNDSFLRMWGFDTKEKVLGRPTAQFWESSQEDFQIVDALRSEGRWVGELVGKRQDGSVFDVQLSASMALTKSGESMGMTASFLDVTERNQAERALKESEGKFRSIVERSPDGVALTDEKGILIEWNPGSERITGLAREEVIGQYLWDIQLRMAVQERRTRVVLERNKEMLLGLLEEGQADWLSRLQETEIERGDGTKRMLQTLIFVIRTAQGHRVGSILRDITESRRVEDEIRKLSRAIEQSPSTVVITDTKGRIEYANPKFTQLTGYAMAEILGQAPSLLKSGEHLSGYYDDLWQTISEGGEWRGEFANRKKNGDLYWELASISPVRDADGRITHYVKVAEDITKRKEAEEALQQRSAELEARNEELDAYAHTVAHDLQNPLGVIIGFAEILEQEPSLASGDELHRYLSVIAQHGRKMSSIIDELLLLAGVRQMAIEAVPLPMHYIVSEATRRLSDMIEKHNAEIIVPERWPTAKGYAPWVEEVWVNYISNAIKYGGQPPRVELGADWQPHSATAGKRLQADSGQRHVRFWIRDNGLGLTPEEQARLFVPFTQLAQVRVAGHGLGLSIVRRIVEKLGGTVDVESEATPGQGCVFSFTLPYAGDQYGNPLGEDRHD